MARPRRGASVPPTAAKPLQKKGAAPMPKQRSHAVPLLREATAGRTAKTWLLVVVEGQAPQGGLALASWVPPSGALTLLSRLRVGSGKYLHVGGQSPFV